MRKQMFAATLMAIVFLLPGSLRTAEAASRYQLCLGLSPTIPLIGLNLNVQGNSILVSGAYNFATIDNHGPVFGSLVQIGTSPYWEMGLTVTYGNMGDYGGPSVQHIVFLFGPGFVAYRLSSGGSSAFVQGTAYVVTCPNF